jgi:SAM-dependent methyltransferase
MCQPINVRFKQRSYQKELLDNDGIPFKDIEKNMQELDVINSRLGGHKITLAGVKELIGKSDRREVIRIVEIGCGGGDNLRVIKKWAQHYNYSIELTGVDINAECIAFAKGQKENKDIAFICSDYNLVLFKDKPHIIFNSLFCHHFTDDELVQMLQWMQRQSLNGFFINDLHRHPIAYYSIKIFTKAFSKSYLVRNDAPLSVLRGFTKRDWKNIFSDADIEYSKCKWKWAFRWLITYKNNAVKN